MREDMFKVIVERPRRGRSWASKSKLRYVKGEGRLRMTGKRIVIENDCRTKYLNENLAPLKRYLFKQRGRKWDDVFSEICQHLDTGSTVKMHVREHIDDFIERDIRIDAQGDYWATGRWGSPQAPRNWAELYVCPKDGFIKETAKLCRKLGVPTRRNYWRERRHAYGAESGKTKHLRQLTETVYLVQKRGIWFKYELAAPPKTEAGYGYSDKDLCCLLWNSTGHEETAWRVLSKQQLSNKQLRKHKLHNAPKDHYG